MAIQKNIKRTNDFISRDYVHILVLADVQKKKKLRKLLNSCMLIMILREYSFTTQNSKYNGKDGTPKIYKLGSNAEGFETKPRQVKHIAFNLIQLYAKEDSTKV
jgi:hypothetical protein